MRSPKVKYADFREEERDILCVYTNAGLDLRWESTAVLHWKHVR